MIKARIIRDGRVLCWLELHPDRPRRNILSVFRTEIDFLDWGRRGVYTVEVDYPDGRIETLSAVYYHGEVKPRFIR
jgi:hypothetical protein